MLMRGDRHTAHFQLSVWVVFIAVRLLRCYHIAYWFVQNYRNFLTCAPTFISWHKWIHTIRFLVYLNIYAAQAPSTHSSNSSQMEMWSPTTSGKSNQLTKLKFFFILFDPLVPNIQKQLTHLLHSISKYKNIPRAVT